MRFQLVTFFLIHHLMELIEIFVFKEATVKLDIIRNVNIEIHWNVLSFGVFWGTSPSTGFKFSPRGYNYCTYFSTKTKFCMFHLV